jgi:altronate dehydratase small subunit
LNAQALLLKADDNVATAVADLVKGERVAVRGGGKSQELLLGEDIPFGFKVSLREIKKGEPILKYGEPIGLATVDIPAGMVVHIHNVEGSRGRGDLAKKGEGNQ